MIDRSAEHTPGVSDPFAVVRRLLRPGGPHLSFYQRFDVGLWMVAGLTAGGVGTLTWAIRHWRRH